MKKNNYQNNKGVMLFSLILLGILVLSACATPTPPSPAAPTQDVAAVQTQSAQTVVADLTAGRKVGGIIIFINFIKPSVAACIMSIAIYMLLSLHISIIIVSAAVVYIISMLLLKTFNENEMIILKGLLEKTS